MEGEYDIQATEAAAEVAVRASQNLAVSAVSTAAPAEEGEAPAPPPAQPTAAAAAEGLSISTLAPMDGE
jgi:hypothetical protein